LAAFVTTAGCVGDAAVPGGTATGPSPALPEPSPTVIPTVRVAPAVGWPDAVTPTPAEGLSVHAFATGLSHPRWLYVLPNGDVLVAETNGPDRPEDGRGVSGLVAGFVQKRAGGKVPHELTGLLDIVQAVFAPDAAEANDRRHVVEGVEEAVRRKIELAMGVLRRNPANGTRADDGVERIVRQPVTFGRLVEMNIV